MLIAKSVAHTTSFYTLAMLRLQPTAAQKALMAQKLGVFSKAVRSRVQDLRKGYFNEILVPFKINQAVPVYPYELPYEALIRGYSEKEIDGRLIDPRSFASETVWPDSYFNESLHQEVETYQMHCSLTPIILHETVEDAAQYKDLVLQYCNEIKQAHKLDPITIQFAGNLQIYTRVDYGRFFMVLPVSDEIQKRIDPFYQGLNALRFQQENIGTVNGEDPNDPIGALNEIHMTLGFHKMRISETAVNQFGMYELHYLNEVLLKPKEELLELYGDQSRALEFVSDVDLTLSAEEIEQLQFTLQELTLSVAGSELRIDLS